MPVIYSVILLYILYNVAYTERKSQKYIFIYHIMIINDYEYGDFESLLILGNCLDESLGKKNQTESGLPLLLPRAEKE